MRGFLLFGTVLAEAMKTMQISYMLFNCVNWMRKLHDNN